MLARKLEEMRQAGTLPAHLVDEEEPREPLLSSFDEAGFASFVLGSSERDVVVLGGAGMSTSAGIPDFRSPGTGLYDNLQKYDLPRPQAIFEISYFRERPQAFYELARELWPGAYAPTPTHAFIKLLHDKGRLLRCFTQNIDSLESAAGLPADRCVAAHGNFDSATCIETGEKVPIEEVKQAILTDGWRELRDKYGGLVKPDIVFFGEGLPRRFFELAAHDLAKARVLIVVGTSLSVQPFASLVNHVGDDCVRALVNRDAVGLRDRRIPAPIAKQLGLGGGFEFRDPRNYRDVALLGNCDDVVASLARALGWAADLAALVAAYPAPRLDRQPSAVTVLAGVAADPDLDLNDDDDDDDDDEGVAPAPPSDHPMVEHDDATSLTLPPPDATTTA
ncbi:hypothetical protein CTAYLR_000350 [Chrysophaeum taylorii]|uniref:Deacetylase sirtuin-type domain-containing protein n=1 Tax=Chrysophaeum taylorii TaxID=2483200 RepID=A0AAD7UHD8_9STRA|nr:hypothetical protein CTAYLR_000350 [Chrysophaeum taylorii]